MLFKHLRVYRDIFGENAAKIVEISVRDRRDIFTLGPLLAPISLNIWAIVPDSSFTYHGLFSEREKQGLNHSRTSRAPSLCYMLSKVVRAIFAYTFMTEKGLGGNLQ